MKTAFRLQRQHIFLNCKEYLADIFSFLTFATAIQVITIKNIRRF